jgi:hypothetical protein
MCSGDRLVADFAAGTDARPGLPEELDEHLTMTVTGQWVVWAHKLARRVAGDLFVPLTGGSGYPADATAMCRYRGVRGGHDAPDPGCTCGFHAVSSSFRRMPVGRGLTALTVALSGRVLAFEWNGDEVLWRAERQTVVRIERPFRLDRTEGFRGNRRPGDPDGRPAVVPAAPPADSGPVRLNLPDSPPVLPVCHDDAGWCVASSMFGHSPASLVLA